MRRIAPLSAAVLLALAAAPAAALDASDGVLTDVLGPPDSSFGWAVSELADVDGDGITDWISGGPFADANTGYVAVHSGASGDELWRVDGPGPQSYLSFAIADVGDVDGNGSNDVAATTLITGRVLVLDGATGDQLLTLNQPDSGFTFFGSAVGDAGDVDGDGAPDILVGATGAGTGGQVYVYSGDDGSILRTYDGFEAGDLFGSGTDGVADVDGDGVTDHVIGARDAGRRDAGEVYVFSGGNGELIHRLRGAGTAEDLGWFFVAGLGDVDGDGVADVYGGDFNDDTGGRSGVRNTNDPQGNGDGPADPALANRADPAADRADRGRAYVWSGATGQRLHSFVGATPAAGMGPGRGAGDVDGDGHEDLVVGSYTSSVGGDEAGRVTVFSGATGQVLFDVVGDVPGEQLGFDAVGLGDLDGDGLADIVVSGAEGDHVYTFDTNP